MSVRLINDADIPQWVELRAKLWPHESLLSLDSEGRAALVADPPLIVFVEDECNTIAGFLELGLRSVAEGCTSSPTPYVEGWYVEHDRQRRGIGRALMQAAEAWSRAKGYTELGSDTEVTNTLSQEVHKALGFTEQETLVVFRKDL